LREIRSPLVKEVRGRGLMIGLEIRDRRNEILKQLQTNKILAIPAGENVVRFLPSYIIESEHLDFVIDNLKKILRS